MTSRTAGHQPRGQPGRAHAHLGTGGEWKGRATSWVSTNRRKAFPGPPGDDGLGYDFRIGSGLRPYMYEVEATQGDGGRFELGEGEVRAAQQHAGNDRWRLLMVTHALAPAGWTSTCSPTRTEEADAAASGRKAARCASRTGFEPVPALSPAVPMAYTSSNRA